MIKFFEVFISIINFKDKCIKSQFIFIYALWFLGLLKPPLKLLSLQLQNCYRRFKGNCYPLKTLSAINLLPDINSIKIVTYWFTDREILLGHLNYASIFQNHMRHYLPKTKLNSRIFSEITFPSNKLDVYKFRNFFIEYIMFALFKRPRHARNQPEDANRQYLCSMLATSCYEQPRSQRQHVAKSYAMAWGEGWLRHRGSIR